MANGRRNFNSNGRLEEDKPKTKINKESLRQALQLYTYIRPYKTKFILSMLFIALSAFTTSLFPFFLGKMIDAAVPGSSVQSMPSFIGSLA
ncbi:MAG: ABC transporter ATP-binding protein, partial [Bacteroidota bacterium]